MLQLYEVGSTRELRFDWEKGHRPWDAPEFLRFVEGAAACGFVCEDYPAGELVPLSEVNRNPGQMLGAMNGEELRQYVHTLHRADKWADGYSSPILEALASGALQLLAARLDHDESLQE